MSAVPPFDVGVIDQIVATTGRPFLVCDEGGIIHYADPAARDALSLSGPSDTAKTIGDLPCDPESLEQLEAAVAAGPGSSRPEARAAPIA